MSNERPPARTEGGIPITRVKHVELTVKEIQEKLQGTTDADGLLLLKSVQGLAPHEMVTIEKARADKLVPYVPPKPAKESAAAAPAKPADKPA